MTTAKEMTFEVVLVLINERCGLGTWSPDLFVKGRLGRCRTGHFMLPMPCFLSLGDGKDDVLVRKIKWTP